MVFTTLWARASAERRRAQAEYTRAQVLQAKLESQAAAQFVLALMEGAVMQARVHRSIEPFDAVVLTLRDYFARLIRDAALQSGPR